MRTQAWWSGWLVAAAVGCGHDDKSTAPRATAEPAPAEPSSPPANAPGLAATVDQAIASAKASTSLMLIPSGVSWMLGVDIAAFIAKPYWRTIKDHLSLRPRRQLEAAERCDVGPDKWRAFVIGVEPVTRDMAMVVEAVGIGKRETLKCLQTEFGNFTLSEDGKEMSDATGGGIVLDEDRIAFATPALMQPLRDRIVNEGQPAADGAMEAVLAKTDLKKPLWFSAIIPPTQAAVAAAWIGGWPSDVHGEMDLSDGVALHGRLSTTDPHAAKTKLEEQWRSVAPLLRAQGIPDAVVDAVTLSAADGVLHIDAEISDAEIAADLAAVAGPAPVMPL